MTPETIPLLTNPEVIAVDQDPAGVQGRRISQEGPLEVWAKPLAGGGKAVALFNRGESEERVTAEFRELGAGASAAVRDLWARKDLGTFQDHYSAPVPRHGVVLLKLK
jgi:alpha-galactosidase